VDELFVVGLDYSPPRVLLRLKMSQSNKGMQVGLCLFLKKILGFFACGPLRNYCMPGTVLAMAPPSSCPLKNSMSYK
jgi:hypothetical protein